MTRLGSILLAFALGAGLAAWGILSRPTPMPPELAAARDSLAGALADLAHLEEARLRAVSKARADSVALAVLQSRVRVRPIPAPANPTPADTGTIPDTVTVFEVPAPVAALVTRLEAQNLSLMAALDTTTLQLAAERRAREFAETLARRAERLAQEAERRRWRYRLEGAGLFGIVAGLASLIGG